MFRPEDPRSALSQALSPGDLCAGEGSESFPLADEIAFLDQRGFDRGLLAAATARALSLGVPAEDVLIREGHCPADRFYGELAAVLGLPFADQFTVGSMPAGLVLSRCEVAQVLPSAGFDYVVAPRGPQIANLFGPVGRALSGTLRIAVTTPARLTRAVVSARGEALASQAAAAPLGDAARWSARVRPTPGQKAALGLVASAVIALVILADDLAWLAAALLLATCFALQGGLRVLALLHGIRAVLASPPPPLSDHALPIYTILVPLYREASVLEALVKALGELDYPASKLDIKLLVEADDEETLRAALRMDLQPPFEVVVCPDGQPRTKPRALNIGLPLARDGLVVVYDAEDRPDRDQLRLAAAQFADNPAQVACLQAALAIDNADESWLTRLFATEYAQLFDVVLPGLARMGLPVPLGGTSNHFRVEALRTAGGWDAWNVTEDADLGLRLAQLGYRVGRLGSTTWEEAPVGLRPWVRQRTRWLKGWHQTTLVHAFRAPGSGGIDLRCSIAIFAQTFGLVLAALGLPPFAAMLAYHIVSGELLAPASLPCAMVAVLEPTIAVLGLALILGSWALGAAIRRVPITLMDYALLPLYLLLGSWAAWCALAEMIRAPFSWAKTEHGVARRRIDRRSGSPSAST